MCFGRAKYCVMEGRNERRALAPGSYIAAAEIGHYVDAAHLGQQCRIAQLQRIAILGIMANSLAMAAYRLY